MFDDSIVVAAVSSEIKSFSTVPDVAVGTLLRIELTFPNKTIR